MERMYYRHVHWRKFIDIINRECKTGHLQNFDKREWIAPTMHILMFFRILSIYPLLTYFIRVQNFSLFLGTEWPGYTKVFLVNACIVAVGCCCAMFYDKVCDMFNDIMYVYLSCLDWRCDPICWKLLCDDLHVFPAMYRQTYSTKRGIGRWKLSEASSLVTDYSWSFDCFGCITLYISISD